MYDRKILVEQTDPELFAAIQAENARQEHHIELIASENYASPPSCGRKAPSSPTNTPKATQASATTVAASTWTWSSNWPLTA